MEFDGLAFNSRKPLAQSRYVGHLPAVHRQDRIAGNNARPGRGRAPRRFDHVDACKLTHTCHGLLFLRGQVLDLSAKTHIDPGLGLSAGGVDGSGITPDLFGLEPLVLPVGLVGNSFELAFANAEVVHGEVLEAQLERG